MFARSLRAILRFIFRSPWKSLGIAAGSLLLIIVLANTLSGSDSKSKAPIANNPVPSTPSTPTTPTTPTNPPDLSPGSASTNGKPDLSKIPPNTPQKYIPAPDPYDDHSSVQYADTQVQKTARPALQHLPLDEVGIRADLTDLSPGGHPVITVTYSGSRKQGQALWDRFLRYYKDHPANYLVIWEKG